jgi:hypothetical protein
MLALGRRFKLDVSLATGKLVVPRSIERVEMVLAKAMKPGRKLLSAVVFRGGHIEELHRHPYRDVDTQRKLKDKTQAEPKENPTAAITVAQPTRGCPVPEFKRAEVRATRVLREFLTAQQLADFERTQSFLVVGADSGHRYVLTSRHAPAERLAKVGGRSVWNATIRIAVCVHDWTVPAAEELLELKLFLELPTRESYATSLLPRHAYV